MLKSFISNNRTYSKALEPLLADIKARQIEVQIDTSIIQEPIFEDFFTLMKK
jgi:hypothetical protein